MRLRTETKLIVMVAVALLLGGCVVRNDSEWSDFARDCRLTHGSPARTSHLFVEPAPWEGFLPSEWVCNRFVEG